MQFCEPNYLENVEGDDCEYVYWDDKSDSGALGNELGEHKTTNISIQKLFNTKMSELLQYWDLRIYCVLKRLLRFT